jgi:histidine ammonia-lyase
MGAYRAVRAVVPSLQEDRSPSPDIDAITGLLKSGALEYAVGVPVN